MSGKLTSHVWFAHHLLWWVSNMIVKNQRLHPYCKLLHTSSNQAKSKNINNSWKKNTGVMNNIFKTNFFISKTWNHSLYEIWFLCSILTLHQAINQRFLCTGHTCVNNQKQSHGWMEMCGCWEMTYTDAHMRYDQSQFVARRDLVCLREHQWIAGCPNGAASHRAAKKKSL